MPVFTPSQPFSKSLFVFFHIFFVVSPYRSFLTSNSIYCVVTIFRNKSFRKANADKAMIAWAVEKLGLKGSPELLFHCWLSSSSFENAFIWLINVSKYVLFCYFFLCLWIIFPISSAMHIEASLPLGSINPYNRSSTLRRSPAVN